MQVQQQIAMPHHHTTPGQRRWRWVALPVGDSDRPGNWSGGILQIGVTMYAVSCQIAAHFDGRACRLVKLNKGGGVAHQCAMDTPDGVECDCEHATYSGRQCKHAEVLQLALAWLEEREQNDWLDGLRQPDPPEAPF